MEIFPIRNPIVNDQQWIDIDPKQYLLQDIKDVFNNGRLQKGSRSLEIKF